jgi:hypothetical protein
VDRPLESGFDLGVARATALRVARMWGVELGTPFAFSTVSYVAPAGRDYLRSEPDYAERIRALLG